MDSGYKCPVCGSKRIGYWHFYNKYGVDGAFYCKDCETVFKAIKTRRGTLKMGKIVREGKIKVIKKC